VKPGSTLTTVPLTTKPDPSDRLAAALTVVLAIPRPEIRFLGLSQLLPTFNFPERRHSVALHKAIMDATTNLIVLFSSSKSSPATNGPFVDLFTCLYRMRSVNSRILPPEPSVANTVLAIKPQIVLVRRDCEMRAAGGNAGPETVLCAVGAERCPNGRESG
jgi:hypothetical protein